MPEEIIEFEPEEGDGVSEELVMLNGKVLEVPDDEDD